MMMMAFQYNLVTHCFDRRVSSALGSILSLNGMKGSATFVLELAGGENTLKALSLTCYTVPAG